MAFSLLKVKNILNSKKGRLAGSGSLDPEIGFKINHNRTSNCLFVTVIGARHLPSLFGLTRAKGYVVKVKIFPGDIKFESQSQDTSWPVWNEEFKFPINTKKYKKPSGDTSPLSGHFLSLTVYAILENAVSIKEDKKKKIEKPAENQNTDTNNIESAGTLAKFEKIMSSSFKSSSKGNGSTKNIPEKRRTIGAATWNFDLKLFQNNIKNDVIGTPDIWRPIEQINSGVPSSTANAAQNENKKGQVEVTFLYSTSEDGCNDTMEVHVNKMRCTINTMQEHELLKETLYIKSSISDGDNEVHWKSDRFFPTISARWDSKISCARFRFNSKRLSNVSVYVSLGCKKSVGIKESLGKVTIDKSSYSDIWQNIIDSPGVPKTHWLPLE